MVKIIIGTPSLTQPFLLYSGLGPAMLDNIGGVAQEITERAQIRHLKLLTKVLLYMRNIFWIIARNQHVINI
jgi:ABC-type arginine/histidine transport system permease subunit